MQYVQPDGSVLPAGNSAAPELSCWQSSKAGALWLAAAVGENPPTAIKRHCIANAYATTTLTSGRTSRFSSTLDLKTLRIGNFDLVGLFAIYGTALFSQVLAWSAPFKKID